MCCYYVADCVWSVMWLTRFALARHYNLNFAVQPFYQFISVATRVCCTVHMWRCLTLDARWKLYKFSKENANVRVKERKRLRGNILSTGSRNSNSQTAPTIHLTYKPQFQFQFILLSHFEHCFCKISLWDCIGQILVVQFGFNHNENKNKRKALTVYGWASKIGLLRFRFHSVL